MALQGAWHGRRADMDQSLFVNASYAVSGFVIGLLAFRIFMSARSAKAKVEQLEELK
jgi:hypothetical protein